MTGSLDLVASESKRCGELVKNLLSFSRVIAHEPGLVRPERR